MSLALASVFKSTNAGQTLKMRSSEKQSAKIQIKEPITKPEEIMDNAPERRTAATARNEDDRLHFHQEGNGIIQTRSIPMMMRGMGVQIRDPPCHRQKRSLCYVGTIGLVGGPGIEEIISD